MGDCFTLLVLLSCITVPSAPSRQSLHSNLLICHISLNLQFSHGSYSWILGSPTGLVLYASLVLELVILKDNLLLLHFHSLKYCQSASQPLAGSGWHPLEFVIMA